MAYFLRQTVALATVVAAASAAASAAAEGDTQSHKNESAKFRRKMKN